MSDMPPVELAHGLRPVSKRPSLAIPMNLKQYSKEVHETAVSKGWWDKDRNFGEIIANIHSEVDEAWKEYVHNHATDETYYTMDFSKVHDLPATDAALTEMALRWSRFQEYLNSNGSDYSQKPPEPTRADVGALVAAGILEPHGVPTELADIMIRVMDMFAHMGLDPDEVVQEKMEYNLTRAHRHGGKRA